jgi:hypothetical protein
MVRVGSTEELHGNISEGSNSQAGAPPRPPTPPVSIEHLSSTLNELINTLMKNNKRGCPTAPGQPQDSTYLEFLVTHTPLFAEATDPLETNNWHRNIESRFGLLHCIEYQKTLFAAQQLCGSASAWWASYMTTLPADHQVLWAEFRTAFQGVTFWKVS